MSRVNVNEYGHAFCCECGGYLGAVQAGQTIVRDGRGNEMGRMENGCFPGCAVHGCEATLCGEFKSLWMARQMKP